MIVKEKKSTASSQLSNGVVGAVTGVTSRFFAAPLDVVKIRFQTQLQRFGKVHYRNPFQALRSIAQEEGITALWKGNLAAEMLWMVYGAVQFSSYDVLKRKLEPYPNGVFAAGFGAASLATIASYPYDILRTRLVYEGQKNGSSRMVGGLVSIAKTEGIRGLYKGLTLSLVSIGPYMGLSFSMYESFKSNLPNTVGGSFVAGLLSGGLSKFIVYPLDTLKKQLQIYNITNAAVARAAVAAKAAAVQAPGQAVLLSSANPLTMLQGVVSMRSLQNVYMGVSAAIMKSALSSALTFGMYHMVKSGVRN